MRLAKIRIRLRCFEVFDSQAIQWPQFSVFRSKRYWHLVECVLQAVKTLTRPRQCAVWTARLLSAVFAIKLVSPGRLASFKVNWIPSNLQSVISFSFPLPCTEKTALRAESIIRGIRHTRTLQARIRLRACPQPDQGLRCSPVDYSIITVIVRQYEGFILTIRMFRKKDAHNTR